LPYSLRKCETHFFFDAATNLKKGKSFKLNQFLVN